MATKWKANQRVYINGLGYEKGALPDGVTPEQWQVDRKMVEKVSAAEGATKKTTKKKG